MADVKKIVRPAVPFSTEIQLCPGRAILIRGNVVDSGSLWVRCSAIILRISEYKRFAINLSCGRLLQGDHIDDVALHINPRFDTKKWLLGKADNFIVLNTLVNNVWQLEHRCENTMYVGKPFSLRILVLKDYYKITLNGKHMADFMHRISIDRVRCLYISGEAVSVEQIEIQGGVGDLYLKN